MLTDMRFAISRHPKSGSMTLRTLALNAKDLKLRAAIREHPRTDESVLLALAGQAVDPHDRHGLLRHRRTTARVLENLAWTAKTPEELEAIDAHPAADGGVRLIIHIRMAEFRTAVSAYDLTRGV